MAVFSIPGNIKQMHLPFVLDPSAQLNTIKEQHADQVNGKPQIFSFRNTSLTYNDIGLTGKLNICPQSFSDVLLYDISYKMLYDGKLNSTEEITINTIFNSIPGIQIREFLPDTRLDQALDFMSEIISQVVKLFKSDKKQTQTNASQTGETKPKEEKDADYVEEGIIAKIVNVCKFTVQYLTGQSSEGNFYSDTFSTKTVPNSVNDSGNLTTYIHKFPYTMWYLLQSSTTTNLYELPCIVNGNEMYSSDGSKGWPEAGLSFGAITNKPLIGKLVKSLLGNINVSFMPWWNAPEGNVAVPPVTISFDLFNDTAENALFNFIFINTLIPNAKMVQYNMFQHSPHLYDIKLEGYGRLYACTGTFKVTQQGILRNMPDKWIDEYLKKRINSSAMNVNDFVSSIKTNKLIKIPDIYRVEMTFTSLLPDSFNNYLFTYSQNANITTEYTDIVRTESDAASLLTRGISTMTDKIVKAWNGKIKAD